MIEVVVREVVVEGRGQFEVEAPDAVIERHSGVQGQREGVFLLHPGIFPILHCSTPGSPSRPFRGAGDVSGCHPGKELHVAEQIDQETAEKAPRITASIGMPVDHRIPGPDGAGLETLLGRLRLGPVRESDGNAEDVIDIRRAGGILEPGPEAETVVMELSIADAEHHIASDHALVGHRDIEPDLQADVPRLGPCVAA